MKRLISALVLVVLISVSQSGLVSAVDVFQNTCTSSSDSTLCKEANNASPRTLYGTDGIITKATRLVAMVVGIAAIIAIIIGGLRYILSSGDPNNISGAKNMIIYAIVGLIVAIIAQGIVVFVLQGVT